jgi:hypothetical protein
MCCGSILDKGPVGRIEGYFASHCVPCDHENALPLDLWPQNGLLCRPFFLSGCPIILKTIRNLKYSSSQLTEELFIFIMFLSVQYYSYIKKYYAGIAN